MADELDPILEAMLRDALRIEAASVPFAITAGDVLRERATRRRGAPVRQLLTVLAAAASITLLGGLGLMWAGSNREKATPTPAPSAGTLASYADLERSLTESSPGEPVLLRGENAPLTGDPSVATIELGGLPAYDMLDIAYACSSGPVRIVTVQGTADRTSSYGARCTGSPIHLVDGVGANSPSRLLVEAAGTASWRVVVAGWPYGSLTASIDPSIMDIGRPGEAVMVTTEGGTAKATSIVVSAVQPGDGASPQVRFITRVPGTVLGADQRLAEPLVAKVGVDGRLALGLEDTNVDAPAPTTLLVDLRTGRATTLNADIEELAFGPEGHLAWLDNANVLHVETAPGDEREIPTGADIVRSGGGTGSPIWLRLVGAGVLTATQDDQGVPTFGVVAPDGSQSQVGGTLPALWGSLGTERPFDAAGHTIGIGCDSSAGGGGGCVLARMNGASGADRWLDAAASALMANSNPVWAADGATAWVLQVVKEAGSGRLDLSLGRVNGDGRVTDPILVATGGAASTEAPAIVGLRDGDTATTPLAIVRDPAGALHLVGTAGSFPLDGAFAGWGGGTGTYPMP